MKKDKITKIILEEVKKIDAEEKKPSESDEQFFIRKKEKVLDMLMEIYTSKNIDVTDLMARKAFIINSRTHFITILLTLLLGSFINYLFQVFDIYFSWTENKLLLLILSIFYFIGIVGLSCYLSAKMSYTLYKSDYNFNRYNTNEFEINLINTILEKNFHYKHRIEEIMASRFKMSRTFSNAVQENMTLSENEYAKKEIAATPKDQNDEI